MWELNDSVIRNCWIKSALVEISQVMVGDTEHVIDLLVDGMEEDNLVIDEACEIMNLQEDDFHKIIEETKKIQENEINIIRI